MFRYLSLFTLLLLIACDPADKNGSFSEAELEAQRTAYAEMMEAHDRAMPRLGEMNTISRGLRGLSDSLAVGDTLHESVTRALQDLERAEDGMMEWMGELIVLDSLRAGRDHNAIMEYLEQETADIRQVETWIDNSISGGRAILGEKGSN